jgi:hypothetical protein
MVGFYLENVISCLTGQEKSCLALNIGGIGIDVREGGHGHEKGNVTGGTPCGVVLWVWTVQRSGSTQR